MSYQLTIEPLGQTITIEDGQTILDASLRAGIYLPHACCHGLCATCKIQVVDGEIEHGEASNFALMDYEREEGKCLACCAIPSSDLVIEAEIDEDPDALFLPVRDFIGKVSQIVDLTPTIKAIHLELDHEMRFQAGQYINLFLPDGEQSRAFSIANPPEDNQSVKKLELNIRMVPGGKATTWIHQQLKVGESVKIAGPYGRFFVRKSTAKPSLFMAGGSGLSSPRSMIHDLLNEGSDHPITLVYGARNLSELYYHNEFLEMSRKYSNFTYVPALSDEVKELPWDGFNGYVHDAAKAHFSNDFREMKAYLCGPPVMIEACIATLMQGRLFERDIYTEKFFSAADAQQVRSPLFKNI